MNKKSLLKHLVFLMFFIFIADLLARFFYWYFLIWYFDMLMHFLGGFWLGLLALYFFAPTAISLRLISKILLFVLLIGIGWEVFEFFTNNYIGHEDFNILDTISDICFDLTGGFLAVFYFSKIIMPIRKNTIQ